MASVKICIIWCKQVSMVQYIQPIQNTIGYYVIKYASDAFTWKKYTTIDGHVSKYGELAV